MHKYRKIKRGVAVFFIIITAVFLFAPLEMPVVNPAVIESPAGFFSVLSDKQPLFLTGFGHLARAQVDPFGGQQSVLKTALGLGEQDPRVTAAKIIRVILGFLGIIAIGLVLYGGFLWMTSEGNEQKIEDAKRVLKNAVIGLAIILASFGIVMFILNALLGASGGGLLGGSAPGGAGGGLTALGNGIIESHYPARGATNIPRNTKIAVTFKEAIRESDIIVDTNGSGVLGDCTAPPTPVCDQINPANVWIFKTVDGESGPKVTDVRAMVASGSKIFVFKPNTLLGSPSENIWYSVGLGRNINKANGRPAFGGVAAALGYSWNFEVSTAVDLTPPQVASVIPLNGSTEPRNVVVQINFDEAVDPISASGVFPAAPPTLNTIVVNNISSGTPVNGTFYISNAYRTVEFITDVPCGVNSCGETIYCLPGNSLLEPYIRAGSNPVPFPYDGVVDMADNSLDGNANGTTDFSPADDYPNSAYPWRFNTNNRIELQAPAISSISPSIGQTGVDRDAPVEASFNRYLMSASINSTNIDLINASAFMPTKANVGSGTTVIISHDQFAINQDYSPQFKSGIRDLYQNCYKPCGGLSCPVDRTVNPSCCNGSAIPDNNWATVSCP